MLRQHAPQADLPTNNINSSYWKAAYHGPVNLVSRNEGRIPAIRAEVTKKARAWAGEEEARAGEVEPDVEDMWSAFASVDPEDH